MRNLYHICGLVVASEVDLSPLPVAVGRQPDLALRIENERTLCDCDWFHQRVMSDGTPWMDVGRAGTKYVLRFPGMAEFTLSPADGIVTLVAFDGLTQQTIQHLFADQVVPLYLGCTGHTVLHASAVQLPYGAVVFVGKSGSGKSTLAASFCQDHAQLIADDCVILRNQNDGLYCIPSYPGLRLWDDSAQSIFGVRDFDKVAHYGCKLRVDQASGQLRFVNEAIKVSRIYFLEPCENEQSQTVKASPLISAELFVRLFESSFRLELHDRELLAQEFERLSRLIRVPVFRHLSYPRQYARLADVRSAIHRDATAEEALYSRE